MPAQLRVTPVIITGGSGTRLWPVSRKSYPKQFVDLFDSGSLFQESCKRIKSELFKPPIIMANHDHRFIVAEQMQQIGIEAEQIILEPVGRNTAPAILVASLVACRSDENALLLVMPSDHIIGDAQKFREDIRAGIELAGQGNIVTFGVQPDCANTAYGYIETSQSSDGIFKVRSFVEKPPAEKAGQYVKAGNYFWNAGIFLFSASAMIEAFRKLQPELLKHCTRALDDARTDLDFLRLGEEAFARCDNISIDYAIAEKSSNIYCKPLSTLWNDLGSWNAMADQLEADENGNSAHGDLTFHQSNNCFGYTDSGASVTLVGMRDAVVVATKDSILVVDRGSVEEVRNVVEERRKNDCQSVESHTRVYRPWGWYESIESGERFQVKCLMVKPGGCLSLQSHHHRAEHWVTVSGTARVTIGGETSVLAENQSIYVPLGTVHRLENPGRLPVLLIEVQSGSYLGEDDIVRYEDVYNRE